MVKFQTQFSKIDAKKHCEVLSDFDAAIPGRTISVKEAAFKYANGLPLDSYFHQPTNIPMRYDVFDILDRGNAMKRDFVLGDSNVKSHPVSDVSDETQSGVVPDSDKS